jgi:cysteine synthase A
MKANSILDTIGNTPHIRLSKLFPDAEVWVKSERSNPGGSIKDRIGLAMIEAAEADGSLKPGGTIVEPTSGNTGIGLAMAAAVKGYKLVLVMPESMSVERRRLMLAYGATFDLTPREKGMKGAIERAIELVETTPGAWMPQQFENEANIDVHVRTTGPRNPRRFQGQPDRRADHGCRHRWSHHRHCAISEAALAESEGLCGRARRRRRSFRAASPHRTRSRALARASFRATCTPTCSTA